MQQLTYWTGITRVAIGAGVLCAASLCFAGQAANDAEARNQENWREAIVHTTVPAEGCFQASYPSLAWTRTECAVAPAIPYIPRRGAVSQTVGNGNDYAAEITSGLISKTIGAFPKVTGVTSETGILGANDYSLQLNSNFMNTQACNGARNPSQCQDWEQFIYSSGYEQVFMQYWLINYDTTCPSGWFTYETDCYTNSTAVGAPKEVITVLQTLKLSGSAVQGGIDTVTFAVGTKAYSTTGQDSVVYLATGWTESEFNIVGDGGGSEADFNSGSSIEVEVAVTNGTENAPTCAAHAGTTGETNNLNLGKCIGKGGARPYIGFIESN
jgi:hypothetical protein